jgi:hypothetical protein
VFVCTVPIWIYWHVWSGLDWIEDARPAAQRLLRLVTQSIS